MANERARTITVTGIVISDKMDKTITVRNERMVKHPRYGKYVRRATTYKAHDDKSGAAVGDTVEILSTRPISKTKSWRLLKVIRRSHVAEPITQAEGQVAADGGDA